MIIYDTCPTCGVPKIDVTAWVRPYITCKHYGIPKDHVHIVDKGRDFIREYWAPGEKGSWYSGDAWADRAEVILMSNEKRFSSAWKQTGTIN